MKRKRSNPGDADGSRLPNHGALRRATAADLGAVTMLCMMSRRCHHSRSRESVEELLAEQPSYVWTRAQRVQAVALCSMYRHPVALMRLLAARHRDQTAVLFGPLLDHVESELSRLAAGWIGVEGDTGWLVDGLQGRGYHLHSEVVGLQRQGLDIGVLGNAAASVRAAYEPDAPRIEAVDRAAFEPFWRINAEIINETLSSDGCVLVAELDDELVGYVSVNAVGGWAYVSRIGVVPSMHGQGIGSRLLSEALIVMRARGMQGSLVNTQADNARSLGLYRAAGYALTGERRSYWAKRLSAGYREP